MRRDRFLARRAGSESRRGVRETGLGGRRGGSDALVVATPACGQSRQPRASRAAAATAIQTRCCVSREEVASGKTLRTVAAAAATLPSSRLPQRRCHQRPPSSAAPHQPPLISRPSSAAPHESTPSPRFSVSDLVTSPDIVRVRVVTWVETPRQPPMSRCLPVAPLGAAGVSQVRDVYPDATVIRPRSGPAPAPPRPHPSRRGVAAQWRGVAAQRLLRF